MNNRRLLVLSCLYLIISSASAIAAGTTQWGYSGDNGSEFWATLSEEYHLCGTGLQQSPVDIATEVDAELPKIEYHYVSLPLVIENNTHTIEVHHHNDSYINIDDSKYDLLQFHFHSPSEHTEVGQPYPMEMHLVHINSSGQLAVIGVFIEEEDENEDFEKIINNAPLEKGTIEVLDSMINAEELLPTHRDSFRAYSGSLTTPPCSEGVRWFILEDKIKFSRDQIDRFLGVIHENARPGQPLNGRIVTKNH